MSDRTLIDAFEDCSLNPQNFRHRDHIRLGWSYLHELPLPEAMIKMRDGLKKYAGSLGVPQKYDEAVTFGYMFIISKRMEALGKEAGWDGFVTANQDLFECRDPYALLGASKRSA